MVYGAWVDFGQPWCTARQEYARKMQLLFQAELLSILTCSFPHCHCFFFSAFRSLFIPPLHPVVPRSSCLTINSITPPTSAQRWPSPLVTNRCSITSPATDPISPESLVPTSRELSKTVVTAQPSLSGTSFTRPRYRVPDLPDVHDMAPNNMRWKRTGATASCTPTSRETPPRISTQEPASPWSKVVSGFTRPTTMIVTTSPVTQYRITCIPQVALRLTGLGMYSALA